MAPMPLTLLGALLVTGGSPPPWLAPEIPPALSDAIRDAEQSLSLPDRCMALHLHHPLEHDYEARNARYGKLWRDTVMIWGQLPETSMRVSSRRRKADCAQADVAKALRETDLLLDTASRLFEESAAPLREGLWVGPLRLCHATVDDASIGPDWQGEQALSVSLTPDARARWAALTARRIGLPVAVRLAGTVISWPRILEPMTDGRLTIGVRSAASLDRGRRMTWDQC